MQAARRWRQDLRSNQFGPVDRVRRGGVVLAPALDLLPVDVMPPRGVDDHRILGGELAHGFVHDGRTPVDRGEDTSDKKTAHARGL